MSTNINFTQWLVGGEHGISSMAIVSHLTGIETHRPMRDDHPRDPDDFTRCAKLLAMIPEAVEPFIRELPSRSAAWAALVERWDEIHTALEEEVPGFLAGTRGSAPNTYRIMREAIDSGRRNGRAV